MQRLILAALAAVLLSADHSHAQAAAGQSRIITVRGEGRAEPPPDHARLRVEVATRGKTIEATTAAHRDRAARATEALRAMANDGIEIESSTFRLDQTKPQGAHNGGPKAAGPGYQAVTTFELKTKRLDAVDDAITAIASNGSFEIHHLRFGVDARSEALNVARRNAAEDARERASAYAEAVGMQLGDILDISDTDARAPLEMAANMPVARNVQVIPPESIALNAAVTITWQIRPKAEAR